MELNDFLETKLAFSILPLQFQVSVVAEEIFNLSAYYTTVFFLSDEKDVQ
jgi:hypothetical protein